MKRFGAAAVLAAMAGLGGCQLGPTGVPEGLPYAGEAVRVFATGVESARLGEPARFSGLTLTPVMVAEDSRCPTGATCVWAGRARVSTAVATVDGSEIRVLTLGTPLAVGDRSVTLVDLCPTPGVQRAPIVAKPVAVYAVSLAGQPTPAMQPCPPVKPVKKPRRLYWPLRL